MIVIKPKTRSKIEIKTLEEIVPYLSKFSKNWKRLTPTVKARLILLLEGCPFYPGMFHFGLVLRKDILNMRSGTFSPTEYRDIFGWTDEEIFTLMQSKAQIFKELCTVTPGQKEFWIQHHAMSEEDAIKAVSEQQRKLSIRKKKTKVNQPTSLAFYIHRGMSVEEALEAQSAVQKKRRNNCIEYWLNKGFSEENAKKKISELQKKRSKLSIEYWLHRGCTLEEAQEESRKAQKLQLPAKFSKISQKFFNEVLDKLEQIGFNRQDFKYGEHEQCVYTKSNKRNYLDFLHVPSKAVVEFDGTYWHAPQEQQDSERDTTLTSMGYSILRIPETYNVIKWDKYVSTAVDFIKENYANGKHVMA